MSDQDFGEKHGYSAELAKKNKEMFNVELMNSIIDEIEKTLGQDELYKEQSRPTDAESFGNWLKDGVIPLKYLIFYYNMPSEELCLLELLL